MSSLYIHIPFCRQACNYCNFHFSIQTGYVADMIHAICKEMELRKHELPSKQLSSIYIGGGTPSILSEDLLLKLFNAIYIHFNIDKDAEITLEANPDDVNEQKLLSVKKTPVNRFSMGVQSFFDEDLKWMNRAHNAAESEQCIKLIQDAGFNKISIDLIYGGPTLSNEHWQKNLEKINDLALHHVSAYCLTAEPETVLQAQISKGKQLPLDEEKAAFQFNMLIDFMEESGFTQYEISNFARGDEYAKHNTSYWKNKPYLGIGPSAHSFSGNQRSWNISNNQQYIKSILDGIVPYEKETLTKANQINEYLMTGLRTIWGCNNVYIQTKFGESFFSVLQQKLLPYINNGQVEITNDGFKLSRKARILADGIASDLFF